MPDAPVPPGPGRAFRVAALVFARAPEPGEVKTRLIPRLGAGPAAVLAARLTLRTLDRVTASSVGPVTLCCSPDTAHPFFSLCERRHGVRLAPQGAGDLGDRMHRALEAALADHDAALLVGTDIPGVVENDLSRAAAALAAGNDAVIGPAEDGGYWLVGARRPDPALFQGIDWSTERVLRQTRERLAGLGWRTAEIGMRWDVDRPEDVDRLLGEDATAPLIRDLIRHGTRAG